jgi:hypothetical protein
MSGETEGGGVRAARTAIGDDPPESTDLPRGAAGPFPTCLTSPIPITC